MVVSAEMDFPTGSTGQADEGANEAVLRAKYADFCSAQLTEVFLALSDERVYELVEEEARQQGLGKGDLGFRSMVKLATKRLRENVPLPDYESWKREYQAEPERYERYMMGLWRPASDGNDRASDDSGDHGEGGGT
ncbi:MAG: hypothetical protein OEU54_14710 [Gemmatimonadota bacterium]|nr:hypothetical protein [Gemmatimonadota bacterium]